LAGGSLILPSAVSGLTADPLRRGESEASRSRRRSNGVKQLSEDSSSLGRYDEYSKNAEGCEHCRALWKKLKETDEERVQMLTDEINRHSKEGRFE